MWLALLLFVRCGTVGFLDDFIKVFTQDDRGLSSGGKIAGQTLVALTFGVLATQFFADEQGVHPASMHVSTTQDWGIKLPLVVVLVLVWFMVTATSNTSAPPVPRLWPISQRSTSRWRCGSPRSDWACQPRSYTRVVIHGCGKLGGQLWAVRLDQSIR
ncbi:hypothetical protein GCM10028820_00070 [Tessaracoccus terricola]